MEFVEIVHNPETSKQVIQRFLSFERKRAFANSPLLLLSVVCLVGGIIGVAAELEFVAMLSMATLAILGGLFGLYLLRFAIQASRLKRNYSSQDGYSFKWSFDQAGMHYDSEDTKITIKWVRIASFNDNGSDIYLFTNNGDLLDIISQDIIGSPYFTKFKNELVSRVTLRH